jgi:hypothetical protein
MRSFRRPTAIIAGLLIAAGILATAPPALAAAVRPAAAAAVPVAGTGTATARSVKVQSATISAQAIAAAAPVPVLGKNGKPAGPAVSTAAPAAAASRPAPPSTSAQPGGPNTGSSAAPITPGLAAAGLKTAPLKTAASGTARAAFTDPSFTGLTEAQANCSNCPTPYVTSAVNATQVAETVNLTLKVFTKAGAAVCTESLSSLFGALGGLTEPRIQYDNAAKRYSVVIASMPTSSSDVPVFYLATSQADDACGAWWVYSIILTGNQYPFGAQLNYPYLGQDNTSLLASTNNFTFGSSYLGTGAFAMPKSAAYAGNPFNITTYSVDFSTAPPVVAGIPTFATTKTFWVAAVPGSGFDVFSMPTSPAGAISFVGTASAGFSPPSRRVRQPGTSNTLDPLDGRIESSVVQDGNSVWFANGIDDAGFPTVLYGAINVNSGAVTDAVAFHTSSSDDFNHTVGVSDRGSGTVAIWVNWAYTSPSAGVPVSDTINGVAPGGGVPNLTGTDLTLVTGVSATSISTFGAYSSVEIDPVASSSSCPAGLTALSAQEYFTSASQWATVLSRTSFC